MNSLGKNRREPPPENARKMCNMVRCPICDKTFDADKSPAMPFCCERCRLIDLGRWLDEKHRLPIEPREEEKEEEEEGGRRNGRFY